MADSVRWGILGLGSIARKMADALKGLPDAELVAVGAGVAAATGAAGAAGPGVCASSTTRAKAVVAAQASDPSVRAHRMEDSQAPTARMRWWRARG